MRWRHLFRVIHRDVGYSAGALVIAYALSGIAVNHIEDWNPSYAFRERAIELGPLPAGGFAEQADAVARRLGVARADLRGHHAATDTTLRVFFEGGAEALVDIRTGRGTHKEVARRAVLFEVNALHLNNLKGLWTWIADVFALALMVLAVTGMTMMKGDGGLAGRGKYFVLGGLSLPVAAVLYLHC